MLMALGIGARKSLTASAALNWMMRDGLGKVARTVVATRFGNSFDSNLKVEATNLLTQSSTLILKEQILGL